MLASRWSLSDLAHPREAVDQGALAALHWSMISTIPLRPHRVPAANLNSRSPQVLREQGEMLKVLEAYSFHASAPSGSSLSSARASRHDG